MADRQALEDFARWVASSSGNEKQEGPACLLVSQHAFAMGDGVGMWLKRVATVEINPNQTEHSLYGSGNKGNGHQS